MIEAQKKLDGTVFIEEYEEEDDEDDQMQEEHKQPEQPSVQDTSPPRLRGQTQAQKAVVTKLPETKQPEVGQKRPAPALKEGFT